MNNADSAIASFGPFRLSPATREIERNGVPLALGDRALDILIALVEHAGEVVSQRDLTTRVWRDLVVSPGNLRVHMSALRKALGDGESGARYIENVTGQGYCFVAPVSRANDAAVAPAAPRAAVTARFGALPPSVARMIGRDETVRTIAADVRADRFVTVVGPGGMGKTTVAISVAHAMLDEFAGNVGFVDFGAVTDPALLAATVASTLGLPIQGADPVPTLMAFLRNTRTLLVLDNCEHVVDAAASLAETMYLQAPDVHILATSRESLRVEGEHAFWLRPLESPPPDIPVSAEQALTYPAVKLFVERATASDSKFELTDANAPVVAGICGRLDGIALALEFVAGRVGTYGLAGTADLLNKSLGLHWQGRRTALPRHQTLHALLEWSYDLLPAGEQSLLRKLSIFVGTFTLEAADAVDGPVSGAVENLIAKSLVSVIRAEGGASCYRLLETTRAFALEKLDASGETDLVAQRHALYFTKLLSTRGAPARHAHLGNLRAALEWSFRSRSTLAVDLAAAGAPAFLEFSLWSECQKWCEAALALLDDSTRGGRQELVLQEARAISAMWTRGNGEDVRSAILRGLAIAQQLGATVHRLRLLTGLHTYLVRTNDFRGSLAVAEQMASLAQETDDESCLAMSDWLRGSSNHFLGIQGVALQLYESGFARCGVRTDQHFGLDYRVRALVGFSRVLWLNGYPERASRMAKQAIDEATLSGKPINACFALIYTCHVFLWCGDLNAAEESLHRLTSHPYWEVMPGFHSEGFAMKGELHLLRGEFELGAEVLRRALRDMKASRQTSLRPITECRLAEAMIALGQPGEARALIADSFAHAPASAESVDAPELLRVKASILLAMPAPDTAEAEDCLAQSLAHARRQHAKGWELRATITMVRLRLVQGRGAEARQLLSAVYGQITEGRETPDLVEAANLLRELGHFDRAGGAVSGVD